MRGPFASGMSAATEHHLEGAAEHMQLFLSIYLVTRNIYGLEARRITLLINSVDAGFVVSVFPLFESDFFQ